MNDRISGDNHAIVLAGMCTALVVVLSLLGFYMPLLSTVVFLLIPLPIAYLGMKEGVKWSIVVTTGVLVLDSTFFGVVSAAFVCAIFGLLGVTMGICYRFKVSAAKTLIAGAVVVLLALVAEGIPQPDFRQRRPFPDQGQHAGNAAFLLQRRGSGPGEGKGGVSHGCHGKIGALYAGGCFFFLLLGFHGSGVSCV